MCDALGQWPEMTAELVRDWLSLGKRPLQIVQRQAARRAAAQRREPLKPGKTTSDYRQWRGTRTPNSHAAHWLIGLPTQISKEVLFWRRDCGDAFIACLFVLFSSSYLGGQESGVLVSPG